MTEFNHILNALPWPSLLVGADLRVGKFNSAAQSMFELAGSKTLLVNIMRHPNMLQAVDVSLNAQIEQKTRYVQRKIEGETVFKVHISPVDPIAGVMVCFENIQAAELLNQLALIEQPGKVFKRVTLLDQVWGCEFDGETRTVDVHIGRLRKVLTQFGAEDVIRTVRGSGYALY